MTAKDQSEEQVATPADVVVDSAGAEQGAEPNPVRIPGVKAPDAGIDQAPAAGSSWQPFDAEEGPVDGAKYAALLKAYEDVANRHASLEVAHATLQEEHGQGLRNLAGRTDEIRRLKKQIDEIRQYGARDLARDVLTTHDNLERTLAAAADMGEGLGDLVAWVEGIDTLFRDFQSTLERHGIRPIVPRDGDAFDPNLHEAMYHAPVAGFEAGQICSVEQIGFTLHDRLLRAARVGVAAAMPGESEGDEA